LPTSESVRIAPADGKLGVLIPGLGAVSTTFIAGVEAIKRGLGLPIGSLTQLATIRLGKRTEARTPRINEFVPLAGIGDLVFGGWDIFEDSVYQSAANAKVLEPALLETLREPLEKIRPMKATTIYGGSTDRTSKKARRRWTKPRCSWKTFETSRRRTACPAR
jgi:myo-inositol-1-phosphate synthase